MTDAERLRALVDRYAAQGWPPATCEAVLAGAAALDAQATHAEGHATRRQGLERRTLEQISVLLTLPDVPTYQLLDRVAALTDAALRAPAEATPGDGSCEWNPTEKRSKYDGEPCPNTATWSIGSGGRNLHVCDSCSALPELRRYRARTRLRSSPPAEATHAETERFAELRHRFDEWAQATEFTRTCKNPVDAGDQQALRDAHDLIDASLELGAALAPEQAAEEQP